jgi:hypothetical protein
VSHYPTNKLIGRELVLGQRPKLPFPAAPKGQMGHPVLIRVSPGYPGAEG